MGRNSGCETIREVANGAENGLWDEKRALKRDGGENEVAAGDERSKTRGKLTLFVMVEYKMLFYM